MKEFRLWRMHFELHFYAFVEPYSWIQDLPRIRRVTRTWER